MKEKVLYINLPDGANYREVKKTVDGRIGIVYTEENDNVVSIPKPIPLIGGTEVYRKDNGTPYWYCKIKNGRDEFMHVYFGDLSENDLFYDSDGCKREFKTEIQMQFKDYVLKALKNKSYLGYRWIPVHEPSLNHREDTIQYIPEKKAFLGFNCYEWEKRLNEYSPRNGSRLASIETYFLLLLRWLKDGIATFEMLTDDWDSEDIQIHFVEMRMHEFGGLINFVRNTYKIVKDFESISSFSLVGAYFDGNDFYLPAEVHEDDSPTFCDSQGFGLLELTE